MARAVLFDGVKCVACRGCEDACKKKYNLPPIELTGTTDVDLPAENTSAAKTYTQPPELSAYTWIKVRTTWVPDHNGGDQQLKILRKCMHCVHPTCVAACPVGALHKDDNGATVYDDKKCIGCRFCMLACPFGVPTFEWDKPISYIRKCIFCPDLLAEGKPPACVDTCAKRKFFAIITGEREELLAVARKRIADGKGKVKLNDGTVRDQYVDHIYGEKEVGGTNWIFISPEPFEMSGLRTYDSKVLPANFEQYKKDYWAGKNKSWGGNWGVLTNKLGTEPVATNAEHAMEAVPIVLPSVAIIMSGLYWVFNRKDKLSQENALKKGGKGVTK